MRENALPYNRELIPAKNKKSIDGAGIKIFIDPIIKVII